MNTNTAKREMMNGKPVLYREAVTALTIPSDEFHEKLLCDGIVFNLGDACAYSCEYCYVGASMWRIDKPIVAGHFTRKVTPPDFSRVVIRRKSAIQLLKQQLVSSKGMPKYADPNDARVVFSSTLVDVAANMDLLRETAAACILLLDHTHWQIRLLSKSNLLHKLIENGMIPEKYHQRLIFGFSTGTLDDRVAKAIETGTPLVSKRLLSLHWLQDRGLRTFGMICPTLPQDDYAQFSREICEAIRVDRCEHVWAEVINLRGKSLARTLEGLRREKLNAEADMMAEVSGPGASSSWEQYARSTFLAHTKNIPVDKLRFLQYIARGTEGWWAPMRRKGAVLLGEVAKEANLTTSLKQTAPFATAPLQGPDLRYLKEREKIVTSGVKASIAAAKALFEIHGYKNGILWKSGFPTFEAYCRARWEYAKSHSYRLVECGAFVDELESQSPIGDCMPKSESQVRPLLALPRDRRLACWQEILSETPVDDLTGKVISRMTRQHAETNGIEVVGRQHPQKKPGDSPAIAALQRLKVAVAQLENAEEIQPALLKIERLIRLSSEA